MLALAGGAGTLKGRQPRRYEELRQKIRAQCDVYCRRPLPKQMESANSLCSVFWAGTVGATGEAYSGSF